MRAVFLVTISFAVACEFSTEATNVAGDGGAGASDASVMCADGCKNTDGGGWKNPDADGKNPGADAGRAVGEDCNVFLDQCGDDLTCGFGSGGSPDGRCRLIGPSDEGDLCGDEGGTSECGAQMACGPFYFDGAWPPYYCQVLCDVDEPLARCTLDQSCDRWSLSEPRLGFCVNL